MAREIKLRLVCLALLLIIPACAHNNAGRLPAIAPDTSAPACAADTVASRPGGAIVFPKKISRDVEAEAPRETGGTDVGKTSGRAESPSCVVPAGGVQTPPAPLQADGGEPIEEPPLSAADVPLTLVELESLALENNPSLAQLTSVVHKAQGVHRQVGLCPNPTVGYIGEEMGDDGTLGQQGGYVAQTIVTGDKLRLNRAVADQNINQLLWELEAQRFRVRSGVRVQFYETLGAQRKLELTRELVEIAEQGLDATRQLRDVAQKASDLDVLQSEVQLSEVRILAVTAEAEYAAAWRKLAALAGRPDLALVPLAGALDGDGPQRDFEATWQELRAASPELQAAQARINRAFAQLQREQAQPIPNILTQVTATHNNATGDELIGVQIGLPLPIFNRNQGNLDVAAAEYHRAVHEARRLELSLRNRLAEAFRQYDQARRQTGIYAEEILPGSRRTLDMTMLGFELGRHDLLRVLTARQTYFESSLKSVQALVELRQAETLLAGLLLTGGLNDVPDIASDVGGLGNRDQALGGQ